jgi:hypothetical protein
VRLSEAMQFGCALQHIFKDIVDADPAFGPVNLINVDLADGIFPVWVNLHVTPKIGVAFPSLDGEEPLAFPMG